MSYIEAIIDWISRAIAQAISIANEPVLWVLLLIIFFVARLYGKLLRYPNIKKLALFGFIAIFVYAPVRDATPLLQAIFGAGLFSNFLFREGRFFSIPSVKLPRLSKRKRNSGNIIEVKTNEIQPRGRSFADGVNLPKNPYENLSKEEILERENKRFNRLVEIYAELYQINKKDVLNS